MKNSFLSSLSINNYIKSFFIRTPKFHNLKKLVPKIMNQTPPTLFISLSNLNEKIVSLKSANNFLKYIQYKCKINSKAMLKEDFLKEIRQKNPEIFKKLPKVTKNELLKLLISEKLFSSSFFLKLLRKDILFENNTTETLKILSDLCEKITQKHSKNHSYLYLGKTIYDFFSNFIHENFDLLNSDDILTILTACCKLKSNFLFPSDGKILRKLENRLSDLLEMDLINKKIPFLINLIDKLIKLEYKLEDEDFFMFLDQSFKDNFRWFNENQICKIIEFYGMYYPEKNNVIFLEQVFKIFMGKYDKTYYLMKFREIFNKTNFGSNLRNNITLILKKLWLRQIVRDHPRYEKKFDFNVLQLTKIWKVYTNIKIYREIKFITMLKEKILDRLQPYYDYKIKNNYKNEKKLNKFFIGVLELTFKTNDILLSTEENFAFICMMMNYFVINHEKLNYSQCFKLLSYLSQLKDRNYNDALYVHFETLLLLMKKKVKKFLLNENIIKCCLKNNPVFLINYVEIIFENNIIQDSILQNIVSQIALNLTAFDYKSLFKIFETIKKLLQNKDKIIINEEIIENLICLKNLEGKLSVNLEIIIYVLEFILNYYDNKNSNKLEEWENHQEKLKLSINFLITKILNIDHTEINENNLNKILGILLFINNKYLANNKIILKEYESILKFCLRYVADHHSKFSIINFEETISLFFKFENLDINFDDGSGLYDKSLLEEIKIFVEEKWKFFSDDFREGYTNEGMKIK